MGFWVMLGSAILGLILIILGIGKAKQNKLWLIALLVGLASFAFAVWLAWP